MGLTVEFCSFYFISSSSVGLFRGWMRFRVLALPRLWESSCFYDEKKFVFYCLCVVGYDFMIMKNNANVASFIIIITISTVAQPDFGGKEFEYFTWICCWIIKFKVKFMVGRSLWLKYYHHSFYHNEVANEFLPFKMILSIKFYPFLQPTCLVE